MKYMLIMNTPKDGYTQYMNWPRKVLEANMAFMRTFTRKLGEAGELVDTVGLASPQQAKLVRAGKDGKPVTDGVFPESKEFLAGYWIIDVESPERALAIAAEAAAAPGVPVKAADGSTIDHLWIEVREVMNSVQDMK
ncbi:MAG: YciI family protein [Gemmatimonadota bacterium]